MGFPEGFPLRAAEVATRQPRRGLHESIVVALRPLGPEKGALPTSSDSPYRSVLYRDSPPYRGVWRGDLLAYVPPVKKPSEPLLEVPQIKERTDAPASAPSKVDWIDVVGWFLSVGGASAGAYLIFKGADENNWDMQAAGGGLAMTAGMWTLMEIVDRSASRQYPGVNRGVRFGIAAGTGVLEGLLVKYAHFEFNFRPEDHTFIDDNPSPTPPPDSKLPVTGYGP